MKRNTENPGRILNQAIDEIRNAPVSAEQMEQAAVKVRQRLQEDYNKVVPHPSASEVERIQSCDDFRALIPAYLTSSLTPSRRLLFEDHVRECVGCRKALEAARRGSSGASNMQVPPRRTHETWQGRRVRWIAPIAAIVIVAVAVETGPVRDWLWPIDVHAVVQMVDGTLFHISGHDVESVKVGQRIERGHSVRTGAASGAMLELADGSRIEMAQRSELSLVRARDGVKIRLARGNVIVSAAKQHGHLYVETSDCRVSVVGTVFSVSSGVKGSRVMVIEGEVEVQQEGGTEQSVTPGGQVFTNPVMGAVSIDQEIGWSRNAEEFLKELAAFGQDFAARAERQSMRYTSDLIPLVPADTLVLGSFPNVSQPFSESYALFRQRVVENATLASWWQQADRPSTGMNLDEVANRISEVGAYLGPEIILAFPKEMTGRQPVLLAKAAQPDVLVSALQGDLRRLAETGQSSFRLAQNAADLAAMTGPGLVIYVDDGLMIASDAAQVQRIAAIHRGTIPGSFSGTPLYQRLQQAYSEGVGWLLAVDLQQIVNANNPAPIELGVENVQQLVLEQKTGIGSAASLVTLGFSQERRGVAAWIAAPAPMGALDFVSPNAYGFSAWITKDPELILDDILSLTNRDGQAAEHLRALQETLRIDLRRDLAEPLGNEVLVAIDGPILPKPSWKVVFEVNDGPRLENAIQWTVTSLNQEAEANGLPTWTLESESVDGKVYHALTSKSSPMEIHYASWMGYMVVASSRALLTDAIRTHDSGNSINHSAAFRALMPSDGRDTASAIMYQNVEAMAQSISSITDVSQQLRESIQEASLLQSSLPKVVFVYGESNRIMGSAQGSFGIRIASMLGFRHMIGATGFGTFPH
jgi:FecR protein/Putative zinc-finger